MTESTIFFAFISNNGGSYSLNEDKLNKMMPENTDMKKIIVRDISLYDYSSSSPTTSSIVLDGPLGKIHNKIHTENETCLFVLMPFATYVQNTQKILTHTSMKNPISDIENIASKYASYVERSKHQGKYEVSKEAPFIHWCNHHSPRYISSNLSLTICVTETEMIDAMTKHEKMERFSDLSEGLKFRLVPLEKGDTGPIRVVMSMKIVGFDRQDPIFDDYRSSMDSNVISPEFKRFSNSSSSPLDQSDQSDQSDNDDEGYQDNSEKTEHKVKGEEEEKEKENTQSIVPEFI